MDYGLLLLVVGMITLGAFVYRFGSAMNSLEQRVSDMQDRLKRMGES